MYSIPSSGSSPPAAPPNPSRRRAALQLALVAGMLALWQVLLAVSGFGAALKTRLPTDWVYFAVLSNGLLGLLGLAVVLRLHGERWSSVGLGRAPVLPTLFWAALATPACFLAGGVIQGVWILVSILARHVSVTQLTTQKMQAMDIFSKVPFALILPLALFAGIYEEILFRGFFLSRLATLFDAPGLGRTRVWATAVLVSSLVFGLAHAYQGGAGMAQTFAVGGVLAILAAWRGNIWSCILTHATIDTIGLLLLRFILPEAQRLLSHPHG